MAAITLINLADQLGVLPSGLRELARKQEDPLPLRLLPGKERGMFINEEEWLEWSTKNCPLVADLPSRR